MKIKFFLFITLFFTIFFLISCEESSNLVIPDESSLPTKELYLDVDSLDFENTEFSGFEINTNKKEFLTEFKKILRQYNLVLLDAWEFSGIDSYPLLGEEFLNNRISEVIDEAIYTRYYFAIYGNRLYLKINPYSEGIKMDIYVSTARVEYEEFVNTLKQILNGIGDNYEEA